MKQYPILVLSLLLASSPGCDLDLSSDDISPVASAETDGDAADSKADAPGGLSDASAPALSYIGERVFAYLNADDNAEWRYRAWNYTRDNSLEPDWILETPLAEHWDRPASALAVAGRCTPGQPGCDRDFPRYRCATQADCGAGGVCAALAASVTRPGEPPRTMCTGHSDAGVDDFYLAIVEAERFVDVTSLTPADGGYLVALANALTYLDHKKTSIDVRLMYGNYPTANVDVDAMLDRLVAAIDSHTRLRVSVGAYRYGFDSWNHAKMVTVDGYLSIVGGTNMWDAHYLEQNPVFDVSMRMYGPSAADAHAFANELWDHVCYSWSWFGMTDIASFPGRRDRCPAFYDDDPGDVPEVGMHVFTVGRLGRLGADVSDGALVAMLDAARESIYLSQQDLGPVVVAGLPIGGWPEEVLDALGRALARGVDVYVVLSNLGAIPGGIGSASAGGGYGNGWTIEEAATHIADAARAHASAFPAGTDIDAALCEQLHVAPIRLALDDQWGDGMTIANHAKTLIVDGRAFYIGSQNLYVSDLAELGYIVDDEAAAADYVTSYWDHLWANAERAAVTGSEAAACIFD